MTHPDDELPRSMPVPKHLLDARPPTVLGTVLTVVVSLGVVVGLFLLLVLVLLPWWLGETSQRLQWLFRVIFG